MPLRRYVLVVETERFEGTTTSDGQIEVDVAAEASVGQLTVWTGAFPEGPRLRWALEIGPKLPPARTPPGGRIRLSNLGYYTGAPVDVIDARLEASIRHFQTDLALPVTGRLDPVTVYHLLELHGD